MNSQRKSDPLAATGDFGELLKSRVESLRNHTANAQAMVCAECGSPLSETSQFCWMCGATRECPTPTTPPQPAAAYTLVPPPSTPETAERTDHYESMAEGTFRTEVSPFPPVNGTDTEASGQVVPPATQPELFSHIYGRDGERVSAEDEEEEDRRKFDYRLIGVPVLLGLIVFLAYQQRRSARDFFVMVREMVADQIAQLWPSEHDHARPVRHPAEPTKIVSARKRAPVREVQRRTTEISRDSTIVTTPLRVSVEGQLGPQPAPILARLERLAPIQPAVAVGITGAAFSRPVPPSPMRVQIAPTESLSLLLKQVPPVYPVAARHAKIQGSVVLKAVIYKDGNVGELSIVSGHPMLVQAAMDAVKQWVYRPYYRNGEPMDVETLVVVEFSLAAEPSAAGGGL